VQVPENAIFVDAPYGQKWKCDRGFEMKTDECLQIKLPENAHLNSTGNGWDCNRPYQLRGDVCMMD
jgi:hypothetical protein